MDAPKTRPRTPPDHRLYGAGSLSELFDLARSLRPDAGHILSFGCSTGEEVESIRRRFPGAAIVGVEINARSRAIARRRLAADSKARVETACPPVERFDIVFAMAVLQFKPDWVERNDVEDLAPYYPFSKFEAEILRLASHVIPGGLLCVMHAHYRVEDTRAAPRLVPIGNSLRNDRLYRPDGSRYPVPPPTSSMFVALAERAAGQVLDEGRRARQTGHDSGNKAFPNG